MSITIYPGSVKKRNANGTYSDLIPGADTNSQLVNDIADAYDAVSGVYSVGDYCIYQSDLYRCTTAVSTPEAFNSAKWSAVSVGDELGGVKNTLNHIQPLSFTVTLSSASWSNKAQTVNSANFIASGYSYVVSPVSTNFSDYANAQIYADDVTTDGSMTFHCASVPTTNLTVNVLRMGVT